MPLVLTLRQTSSVPLEVDTLRLETARTQTPAEVARTRIQHGNRQVPLGDFFDVTGSAVEDNTLIWQGDCSRVKLIGHALRDGTIRVQGNAGMHLGAEMRGGEIVVEGNAGDWVGAEMHGGRIHVHGNAGHLVGAVYRGGQRGMTGGEILIDGHAGNEIGHTMRRGLIAIGGRAGDAVGFNMIAGSVFVFGTAGIRPGAGMRRGTLAFFSSRERPDLLPTFQFSNRGQPLFFRLYLRHLQQAGFAVPDEVLTQDYLRYCGDFLELGKGEIFFPAAAG